MDEEDKVALYNWALQSSATNRGQLAILSMLSEIHSELVKIREATETEAVEDAEPDPFQTLNGPSKDQNPLRYGVKGEYGE